MFLVDCRKNRRAFAQRFNLIAAALTWAILLLATTNTHAASVGFSGTVPSLDQAVLIPERRNFVTFSDQVVFRFGSMNKAPEAVKIKLSIKDSQGNRVRPRKIRGNNIVSPNALNQIILTLPISNHERTNLKFCVAHLNAGDVLVRKHCERLNVVKASR